MPRGTAKLPQVQQYKLFQVKVTRVTGGSKLYVEESLKLTVN